MARTISTDFIISQIPLLSEDELRKLLEKFSREAYDEGEKDERESHLGYDTYSQ